jgi:predicted PhzF superfamily epimerase YddE/YHI9
MTRRFFTLDVFAETALAGNPLAVVLDCGGLDDRRMQAIAREFNLSETVFVFEPMNPVNTARVRIFTPARELPFAGHPTVGTAALIAHIRARDLLAAQDMRIVLEEGIGDVACVVRLIARAVRSPRISTCRNCLGGSKPRRRRRWRSRAASAFAWKTSASTGMSLAFSPPARRISSFRCARSTRSAARVRPT